MSKLILEVHASIYQKSGSVSVICSPKDIAEVVATFKIAGFSKAILYQSVIDEIESKEDGE